MRVETIAGCYTDGKPLLTRYHIWHMPWGPKIYLHVFHRSDEDRYLHSHPWFFWSLILWGGYTEVRPTPSVRYWLKTMDDRNMKASFFVNGPFERKKIRPGSIIHRPAWWAHRVEIPKDKCSVSLVLVAKKKREWGFFSAKGWIPWEIFTKERECE